MNNTTKLTDDEISQILNNPDKMTKIIQSGIKDALRKHKLLGNPVCESRDNKIVWIAPEDIKL